MRVPSLLIVTTAAIGMIAGNPALAVDGTASSPVSTAGVVPYIIPGANNGGSRTCAEVGEAFFGNAEYYQCWSGDRNPDEFGLGFPDISGNPDCDRNLITASNDGTYVEFTAGPDGVGAAIIKGGNAANVYVYQPQAFSDSGLASPLVPAGTPAGLSHSDGFCWNPGQPPGGPTPECFEDETAWAQGSRYVNKGNWAMYLAYPGADGTVDLIAGQNMVAGEVTFSASVGGIVTITIELFEGWRFALNPIGEENGLPIYDNNVKVQDYAGKPPGKNPAPGLFLWKIVADGDMAEIEVPYNNYYGVHVDVERQVDCPEIQ
jgi:hypothetical protein